MQWPWPRPRPVGHCMPDGMRPSAGHPSTHALQGAVCQASHCRRHPGGSSPEKPGLVASRATCSLRPHASNLRFSGGNAPCCCCCCCACSAAGAACWASDEGTSAAAPLPHGSTLPPAPPLPLALAVQLAFPLPLLLVALSSPSGAYRGSITGRTCRCHTTASSAPKLLRGRVARLGGLSREVRSRPPHRFGCLVQL